MDATGGDSPIQSDSVVDLNKYTAEELKQIQMKVDVELLIEEGKHRARQLREQAMYAVAEPQSEPDTQLLPTELYDKHFFWTKVVISTFWPLLIAFLMILLIANGYVYLTAHKAGDTSQLLLVGGVALIGAAWFVLRDLIKAAGSGLIVDEEHFITHSPRQLFFGLLGNRSVYPKSQVTVTAYHASFWNFLPTWNSWEIFLDTPNQEDEGIRHFKHVRDGDAFVRAISPGLVPTKRKLSEVIGLRMR